MYNLIFTVVLYGLTFNSVDAGKFATVDLCETAKKQLSGENWVGRCESAIITLCNTSNTIYLNKMQ